MPTAVYIMQNIKYVKTTTSQVTMIFNARVFVLTKIAFIPVYTRIYIYK